MFVLGTEEGKVLSDPVLKCRAKTTRALNCRDVCKYGPGAVQAWVLRFCPVSICSCDFGVQGVW